MTQPLRSSSQHHAPERQARGNEQRRGNYGSNGQLTVEQQAGVTARHLIQQTGVEDSTPIWRALKRAYLAGYADAQR